MSPRDRIVRFRRLALAGAALAAIVVVLGAWVRLTNAGLGCPDWPGCYGHPYPQAGAPEGKAWHEMIHRYVAGSLATLIVGLTAWALIRRKDRGQPVGPVIALFVLVCLQATLGALTVTMRLMPLVVTAHLFGGLCTLGLLWWLSITPERRSLAPNEAALRGFALAAFVILIGQIFLGGWTSSNYAAVACPDFPTCRQSWWPSMDFRDAYVLFRTTDASYEGGLLANSARVAIHFTHRLGALVTGVVLLTLGAVTATRARTPRLYWAGLLLMGAVVLQIAIGISTVRLGFPLPVATLHNAGAALLVGVMLWLLRALWPGGSVSMVPFEHVNRT